MRSEPPGPASDDHSRARTFRTALEQSEQFLRGAEARGVGYEVKPVFILYGLYQGARALAAASPHLEGRSWRLRGHGMVVKEMTDQANLGDVAVTASASGSPQIVAAALGSCFMPKGASTKLADLWPLVPMVLPLPGAAPGQRPALHVEPGGFIPEPAWWLASQPYGNLQESEGESERKWLRGFSLSRLPTALAEDTSVEAFQRFLSGYPELVSARPEVTAQHNGQCRYERAVDGLRLSCQMRVLEPAQTLTSGWYRGQRWALPAVPGMTVPLHPFIAWWAILLALSSLARYEPETWADMVDVDRSGSPATAVEHLLDTALDAVPQMLVEAITGASLKA
jgi:hypothetical protein